MSKKRWYLKGLACVLFATANLSSVVHGDSCASPNLNECCGSEAYWEYAKVASNENVGIKFSGANSILPTSVAVDQEKPFV